jgi:hypothetical protein
MEKAATMAQPFTWSQQRNHASAETVIRTQLDNVVRLAKALGISPGNLANLTGEVLRHEIVAPAKEGYATEAEGLAELFTDEGGCVDVNVARGLYRKPKPVTRQRIAEMIRDGELIGYRTGAAGEYSVPVWQFLAGGGVIPGLPEVLKVLQAAESFEPITPFTFLLQENPLTGGETPLAYLRQGKKEEVLFAAAHASG